MSLVKNTHVRMRSVLHHRCRTSRSPPPAGCVVSTGAPPAPLCGVSRHAQRIHGGGSRGRQPSPSARDARRRSHHRGSPAGPANRAAVQPHGESLCALGRCRRLSPARRVRPRDRMDCQAESSAGRPGGPGCNTRRLVRDRRQAGRFDGGGPPPPTGSAPPCRA